jgi:oxalate decarboxylase
VNKSRAKMTILSPGDKVDTFGVGAGEIVFIPPAYLHYIENIDANNNTHFVVFFG